MNVHTAPILVQPTRPIDIVVHLLSYLVCHPWMGHKAALDGVHQSVELAAPVSTVHQALHASSCRAPAPSGWHRQCPEETMPSTVRPCRTRFAMAGTCTR
jgi:hypothetical protein